MSTIRYQFDLWSRVLRKLLSTESLPRWLRRVLAFALVVKALPIPDFGIDEAALGIVFGVLAVGYPGIFSALVAQSRSEITREREPLDTSPEAGCY